MQIRRRGEAQPLSRERRGSPIERLVLVEVVALKRRHQALRFDVRFGFEVVEIITYGKGFPMGGGWNLINIFGYYLIDKLIRLFSGKSLTGVPQLTGELHIHRCTAVRDFRFTGMHVFDSRT